MKITCDYGEFDIHTYRNPGEKFIRRGVSVESLVSNLSLSLRNLPRGSGVAHVDLDGEILVPVDKLNAWLMAVKVHPDVINDLSLHLSERSHRDVGFLSYAHIQLQEALTDLGGYYTEIGIDAEYPVEEVEDSLYQIFCEFLTCGEYDPLLMQMDNKPMTTSESWMLSILETTASELIHEFIKNGEDPEGILKYLQIFLKDRVSTIGYRVSEMASTFTTVEDV